MRGEEVLYFWLIRIICIAVVAWRAQARGRSSWPWVLLALFLPGIAIIAIWFVRQKAVSAPASKPLATSQATPPQPAPAAAPVRPSLPSRPALSESVLKDVDRSNHKLLVRKVAGSASGRTLILVTVIMPLAEYTQLLLSAGGGTLEQERAALLQLVKQVFPRAEHGASIFHSEAEYAAFLQVACPERAAEERSNWFKTVGFAFSALAPEKEPAILQFVNEQSRAFSASRFGRLIADVQALKPDWPAFQQLLRTHHITKLYHFTDRENLESILSAGGLLSWYSCQQHGLAIPRPGGSEVSWQLDAGKGLQDYVRLAFVPDHPMLYVAKKDGRISSEVVLEIDPAVVYWASTKFTAMNAAKSGVTAAATLDRLAAVKFPVFRRRYFDLSEEDKPYYQAEVLVHRMVPLRYITNLEQVLALA